MVVAALGTRQGPSEGDGDGYSRGFAVPWTMYIDYDGRFWLNGNYSVYPEPSEKACMEAARTSEGYFVGIYRCLERTWSPEGGYTDLFVPLPVLNLRSV